MAATGLLLLTAGCQAIEKYSLTHRLWSSAALVKVSEPAPKPNLALFAAPNRDVLVQYDALGENGGVKRRSYYLWDNQARIAAGTKPKWAKASPADGMPPLRVLSPEAAARVSPSEPATYAVATQDGQGFTLVWLKDSRQTFPLPVYDESSGTATRLALTPFTLAGDTVMVGLVASVAGLVLWVQSGSPTY